MKRRDLYDRLTDARRIAEESGEYAPTVMTEQYMKDTGASFDKVRRRELDEEGTAQ